MTIIKGEGKTKNMHGHCSKTNLKNKTHLFYLERKKKPPVLLVFEYLKLCLNRTGLQSKFKANIIHLSGRGAE